jgi:tRNA threonylcarbamoyladenosine biosynthesis protein TsaB
MKLLAIETAFEACSVALCVDGECRERFEVAPRGHAERLLPWVEALLAEAELPLSALDAIAFSQGPGSFTSLRIGISVTQGLAFGAGLPVVPVSSLATLALAAGVPRALVAMDARMGEVYAGAYTLRDGIAHSVMPDRLATPEQLSLPEGDGWTAVGNGFERFDALAALAAGLSEVKAGAWPTAKAVALLAQAWLRERPGLPAEAAEPVYLRDKVADKPGR